MIKIFKNICSAIIIFFLNYVIMFCFMYVMDYTNCPFSIICYLTAVLVAIVDYILMCFLYKSTKITPKLFGIFIIFTINELSVIAGDKLIRSDDAFAILEGSRIITNALVLVIAAVIVSSILSAKK